MTQSTTNEIRMCDRPMAGPGLISYRCKGRYGYIMIGARSDAEALREARRSWDGATGDLIEIWNGSKYVPANQVPHL